MVATSPVISLAILKVNWDTTQTGYLDNFVPFVAESIRVLSSDVVSIPEVQAELRNQFSLQLPQSVITAILLRVKKLGYIRAENRVYLRNSDVLATLNFHQVQQDVVRMHGALIERLTRFCSESHGVIWTRQEADAALEAYLQQGELVVTGAQDFTIITQPLQRGDRRARYLVGAFIHQMQNERAAEFDYFETVVKGNMLASAIFLPDPQHANRRFNRTEIYFDTPFLVRVLGYAGDPRKEPCLELLRLLQDTGASLKCFAHTIDEIRGVLDYVASIVERGKVAGLSGPQADTVEYFLSNGCTGSDIHFLSAKLERGLRDLGIAVLDKPSYSGQAFADE